MIFTVPGAVAELERNLIKERVPKRSNQSLILVATFTQAEGRLHIERTAERVLSFSWPLLGAMDDAHHFNKFLLHAVNSDEWQWGKQFTRSLYSSSTPTINLASAPMLS